MSSESSKIFTLETYFLLIRKVTDNNLWHPLSRLIIVSPHGNKARKKSSHQNLTLATIELFYYHFIPARTRKMKNDKYHNKKKLTRVISLQNFTLSSSTRTKVKENRHCKWDFYYNRDIRPNWENFNPILQKKKEIHSFIFGTLQKDYQKLRGKRGRES